MSTRTIRIVLGMAFLGVLLGISILGGRSDDQAQPVAPQPATSDTDDPTPTPADTTGSSELVEATDSPSAPTDAESERTEAGARRAAISYLESTERIVELTPTEAADAQRAISTAASGDRLAAEVETQMIDMQSRTPQGLAVWIAPITARSVETPDGYVVSVWYAEVVAVGTAIAVDNWRTITYSLVWEANTWLIDEQSSTEGPVPSRSGGLTVTPPSTLVAILSEFSDDQVVPVRTGE